MNDPKRILVVDDNRDMLKILTRTLELEGFEIFAVNDGDSALHQIEAADPDLVLLDIIMPGRDGLQVLNQIREFSDVPVIMLTAKTEVAMLNKSLLLGADDYVHKPFSSRALLARIRAKLRRPRTGIPPHLKNAALTSHHRNNVN